MCSIEGACRWYARHYRLLKEIEVSYPETLLEQQRIVKILDEVFEKIDKAKENVEKIDTITNDLDSLSTIAKDLNKELSQFVTCK